MIQLHFDKLYSGRREQEHCQAAIPFAKGTLHSTQGLRVIQNDSCYPAQFKVTSVWDDGSIRWLHIRFLADLPSNAAADCYLAFPEEAETAATKTYYVNQISENKNEGSFTVSTGALTFTVAPHTSQLIQNVTAEGRSYQNYHFSIPVLTEESADTAHAAACSTVSHSAISHAAASQLSSPESCSAAPCAPLAYSTDILSWRVLEQGNLVTILEGQAVLRPNAAVSENSSIKFSVNSSENSCAESSQKLSEECEHVSEKRECSAYPDRELRAEIRLTAWAGKPWLEAEYRLINTSEDELPIHSLLFTIQDGVTATSAAEHSTHSSTAAPVIRTCAANSNYKTDFLTSKTGAPVRKLIDSHHLLYEANEHFAEVFYGTLFCDRTTGEQGLCATVYQGQQNYPKAVEADAEKLVISLVPEDTDKVKMQSGMARCQRVLLHFHASDESLQSLNNRSTIYQMPDKCHIAPKVFHEANVFEDVFADKKNPQFESFLTRRGDSHSRGYGMMNWGDSPDPGYTSQGRGGDEPVWTNNEYDYPHACYLMYARTGLRRFLDYGLVAADHWMDVDVCHYSNDPLLFGGQWEHTNGHCKNGHIVCSHEWVEGLLDTWHFTGNPRALETAIGIGENVLRLLDTPMFHQKGGINARETGWALRTLVALYKETYDEKWLKKCDWIVGHFTEWKEEYGQWLSPYLDNVAIHVVFMISIAASSLMRYYRIRPQEHIKYMILDAVDDMIENCMLEDGTFYYKELPSLNRFGNNPLIMEALQNAYELTGNADYLKPGLVTFRNTVNTPVKGTVSGKKHVGDSVIVQGDGTKTFGQSFLPLALFYKAASDNDLL